MGRRSALLPLEQAGGAAAAGAKAARLAAASRAGLPVLPGWVVPCARARPALRAGAAAVAGGRPAAARRAVLSRPLDPALAAELAATAAGLGGQVIVRSSSPLERDPRWSGAFSSVAEVGPADVATAVRSCWAAAFAVDPLARLAAAGLPVEALELGILIQPELHPDAGGVARLSVSSPDPAPYRGDNLNGSSEPGPAGSVQVLVAGVKGHPGALLAGWAEGESARMTVSAATGGPSEGESARVTVSATTGGPSEGGLISLIGAGTVEAAARLAASVYRLLGDDTIEWASSDGKVWLLQSLTSGPVLPVASGPVLPVASGPVLPAAPGRANAGPGPAPDLAPSRRPAQHPGTGLGRRERMPALAAAVQARGQRIQGRPAAAGTAAGRLVACRPHERPPAGWREAILLVDRPLPALAPLLFGARGVIARRGAAGSHLAEVARSLAVPMVTGCQPEAVTGPRGGDASWFAAIDGSTGDVALLPG